MKTSFRFCVIAFAAITVLLTAGCNINVTTGSSGQKTPVAGDFTVSNLTQAADNIIAVTVAPKSGKSGGAVTVYYNGSTSLPTAAGAYTVTFDVAEVDGWKAANGLAGGKLAIIPPGQTPVDSLEEAAAYLSEAEGGESEENAVYFLVNIDLNSTAGGASGWQQLLDAIEDADKFITLDLSLCEMNGTVFNPDSSLSTGKDKIVSITLPAAAKSIASGTFNGGTSISTFNSFDNLKTVSGAYVAYIGSGAFEGCSSLIEVNFPLAVSIGTNAFRDSGLIEANFPLAKSVDAQAFWNCSLTKADFSLAESIGSYAFADCGNLTEVNIPLAESIGWNAFNRCNGLIEVDFPLVASIGSYAFADCGNLTEANFPLAESIGTGAFYYCSSLTDVSFPLAESIGDYAFQNCSSLTEADFPLAESIGGYVFYNCSSLNKADFPLAKSIGSNAFLYCSSLSSITIAANCDIDSNAQIRGNFSDYYDSQSKAAGTYTYDGSSWEGPF